MLESLTIPVDYLIHAGLPIDAITRTLWSFNPSNDQVIDSFQTLLMNLKREYAARTSRRFRRGYWEMLPPDDQLIAEAESEWLEEAIRDVTVAMHMYALSKVEPVDETFIEADWVKAIQAGAKQVREYDKAYNLKLQELGHLRHAMTLEDLNRRLIEYEAAPLLVPPDTPLNHGELALMRVRPNEQVDQFELFGLAKKAEADGLRYYRDHIAPINSELIESMSCTMSDLQAASIHHNQDKSKKAIPPIILFDSGIPKSKPHTWFGWFQLCGVAFRRLSINEAARIYKWFDGGMPQYIITYVLPFMPRTQEHMTGGQVQAGNAGDASWSLNSKSRFHARDSEGRIDYGQWRVRTSVLGWKQDEFGKVQKKSRVVIDHAFDSMHASRLSFHELAIDTLPGLTSTAHMWAVGDFRRTIGFEGLNSDWIRKFRFAMPHPGLGGGASIPMFQLQMDEINLPMAALAHNWQMHLRFGSDLDGLEAAELWCAKFEADAIDFAYTPRAVRFQEYMKDANARIFNTRNPGKFSHYNHGGVNTVFDFTNL